MEQKLHMIECEEPWFSLIRSGAKPLTGRKNSPKYQNIRPGDAIELFCKEQRFRAKCADIKKFASIEEYLNAVTVEKALPGVETMEEALKVYSKWSTPEEVAQYGFIAIYIAL